jgi:hypothetical protein
MNLDLIRTQEKLIKMCNLWVNLKLKRKETEMKERRKYLTSMLRRRIINRLTQTTSVTLNILCIKNCNPELMNSFIMRLTKILKRIIGSESLTFCKGTLIKRN